MARIPYLNGVLGTFVFLLLIAIVTMFVVPPGVRATAPDLSLHMLGEAPQFNGPTPVLVAGIWHEIDVNLTAPPAQNVTLQAFLPGGSPVGPANTYAWEYNPVTGSWADPLYNAFLRTDLSYDSGRLVVFVVGDHELVDATRGRPGKKQSLPFRCRPTRGGRPVRFSDETLTVVGARSLCVPSSLP